MCLKLDDGGFFVYLRLTRKWSNFGNARVVLTWCNRNTHLQKVAAILYENGRLARLQETTLILPLSLSYNPKCALKLVCNDVSFSCIKCAASIEARFDLHCTSRFALIRSYHSMLNLSLHFPISLFLNKFPRSEQDTSILAKCHERW